MKNCRKLPENEYPYIGRTILPLTEKVLQSCSRKPDEQERGSMIFFNKKNASKNERTREMRELKRQIEISRIAIQSAQSQFEQVVDPTLIDCYIYELNAAQLRYQFLLQSFKKRELQEV